ncbi:hypothetical protein CS534_17465 [Yersinia ruckeri]|nr:hypothetical protein CS534_17465 [Yersinia ruckeri]
MSTEVLSDTPAGHVRYCCPTCPHVFQLGFIISDSWGSYYAREVPREMYLTGKIFTQRIERNNLTFRTRLRQLHALLSSTRKSLAPSSKNTTSTDWMNYRRD